jgi:hypothetical protein
MTNGNSISRQYGDDSEISLEQRFTATFAQPLFRQDVPHMLSYLASRLNLEVRYTTTTSNTIKPRESAVHNNTDISGVVTTEAGLDDWRLHKDDNGRFTAFTFGLIPGYTLNDYRPELVRAREKIIAAPGTYCPQPPQYER